MKYKNDVSIMYLLYFYVYELHQQTHGFQLMHEVLKIRNACLLR